MNLLLLLSAFLSALTGAITGTRVPEVQMHRAVAESRVARPVPARAAVAIVRPVDTLATLAVAMRAPLSYVWQLADSIPLYAARRRE